VVVKTIQWIWDVFIPLKFVVLKRFNRSEIKKETFPWKNGKVSFF
jgi:hypothetical protein